MRVLKNTLGDARKKFIIIIIIFMHWKGTKGLAFALGNIVGALGDATMFFRFFKKNVGAC
jgi:hypothetical protein